MLLYILKPFGSKRICVLVLQLLFISNHLFSQDIPKKWQPSFGLGFTTVPTNSVSGTDTIFANALAISPSFTIRNIKSGFGIIYSPAILAAGFKPGVYAHTLTAGFEQYDKETLDFVANYSHFFFTNNSLVPYTPLNNEIYTVLKYKKWWIQPSLSAGIGFGSDKHDSSSAYDIGLNAGLSHDFSWESNETDFSLIPSVSINAGTNQYFSFLSISKYIGHSKGFTNYIKRGAGKRSVGRGRGNSSGGNTTTTTTAVSHESFSLSNVEMGFESSAEIGSFTIRPTASVYIPVGTASGSGVFDYWQIILEYNF